jgi:hypothetical protein
MKDYDDGIDRKYLYDCCVGLLSDENSDLNGVNFQFLKNNKNEVIVRVWKGADNAT